MIESILRFDDVEGRFKGHVCGQENGVGDGLRMRLNVVLISTSFMCIG